MMRLPAIFVGAALALTACRSAERASGDPPRSPDLRRADIYFSTSVLGYIEPCGCTSKPLGGIQRLATVLERNKTPHILVDSGDFLFPEDGGVGPAAEQHFFKAKILARVYRSLGAAAINVGPTDLSLGPSFLRDLQADGAVPWVSANLRPGERGPSIAQSFLNEVGGVRVGITGASALDAIPRTTGTSTVDLSFKDGQTLRAVDLLPALRAEVQTLRERNAEVIVLLARMSDADARMIAREVPGFDVIIRGPGTPITRDPAAPDVTNGVALVESGSQGQRIGVLHIELGPGQRPRPLPFDDGGARKQRQAELNQRKQKALEREIETLSKDPTQAEAVAARKAQLAKLSQVEESASIQGPSKIRFELIPLTTDIDPDGEMTSILSAYYVQLRDLNLEKGDLGPCVAKGGTPKYVGTQKCIECHEEEYNFWKKTKHAAAWQTLEKDQKHFDLTCIGCHTVGYQLPGGFCRLKDVGELKDVGCEMCHGPGQFHIEKDGDSDEIQLTVTEKTCAGSCHVPEHSDTFNFPKYVRQITGEGHPLSETSSRSLGASP